MGLLSRLFGARDVHVYLHVDGEIAIKGISQLPESISREARLTEQMAKMDPDLSNIQIPEVDFGSDVEDTLEKE
jgi:hypothetical protein